MSTKSKEQHDKCCNHSCVKKTRKSGLQYLRVSYAHLEVRKYVSGECTICGMSLDPEVISGDVEESMEMVGFRKKLFVGIIFTMFIFSLFC